MTQQTKDADWAGARGEKWRRELAGHEAMLHPVTGPLMAAVDLRATQRIADIGCGGGATTVELWRRAPRGSDVHGFDLSPLLVDVGRSRIPDGADRLAFNVANMEIALPPAGAYDQLVSRFGVMFYGNDVAAFSNVRRWLVPGGRFAFAVWGPLADNPWMTTIRETVAEIVDLPPLDASAPGPFRYGDVTTFTDVLTQSGFSDVNVVDWRGVLPLGDSLPATEAARFAVTSFSNYEELLAAAGDHAIPAAQRSLAARLAPHERDGVVAMDARVHIVTGRRRA